MINQITKVRPGLLGKAAKERPQRNFEHNPPHDETHPDNLLLTPLPGVSQKV